MNDDARGFVYATTALSARERPTGFSSPLLQRSNTTSFSPPHDAKNKEQQKENVGEDMQNADETSTFHLTSQARRSCSDHQEVENNALSKAKNIVEESLLTIGLRYEKLKGRRTGFKLYKRCSLEAQESRVMKSGSQVDEKDPKRVPLEGEACT
ncbi:hypothetical protein F3Y22_tig00110575pilonHSYRG00029 [Hibiscus syriacus]|uniref:Uncharacterized protein n=1 Tax=Hibiscus syriacus TaxID=106335 RepID=A0A6A3A9K5_HIBSY|nr:hypothetical protein F3Y22_tig00110575pilonHSYRG00029 [Hibiscus syriacus]